MLSADFRGWRDRDPLIVALVVSLLGHVLLFGVAEVGSRFGWWSAARMPAWLKASMPAAPKIKPPTVNRSTTPNEPIEMPLLFVDVSASQVTPDAPKNAKYYASQNSRAANPDVKIESYTPNISGKKTPTIKATETSREKTFPLQPAAQPKVASKPVEKTVTPANPSKDEKTLAPPKPQGASKPGDMAKAKPADSPTVGEDLNKRLGAPEAEPMQERPRTLAEAKARMNPALAGDRTKQDGGVKRRGAAALDAKGTQFGRYDAAFIAAVQNRWYDLIDERGPTASSNGKVVVMFSLFKDGTIRGARIVESTVDTIMTHLCQRAIEDPAPYETWPSDMLRMIGSNSRELTFTFYYN